MLKSFKGISSRSSILRNAPRRLIQTRLLATDSFLQSNNANYIDEMYEQWSKDPSSVHSSWNAYFKNLDQGVPPSRAFQAPPTLIPQPAGGIPNLVPVGNASGNSNVLTHLKAQLLVRAYQVRGHQKAKIDPLGISFGDDKSKPVPKELTQEFYGFTEADLDTEITLGPGILPKFAEAGHPTMKLRDIIKACEKIYCSSYGVEYVHIPSREKCDWLRERIEIPTPYKYSVDEKRQILDRLIWSCSFENFLSSKFPNDKRFGVEGAESVIPGMKALIDTAVENGVEDVVIGMAHRGRLNMLSNVVRKPNESIFSEFTGSKDFDEGSGDVKYHLGMNYVRPTTSGKKVHLSLVANPSHLEAEDPVVLGRTRAIQHYKGDVGEFNKAMGILVHGDAAFAGQGIVYETMGFAALPAYSTGGTIHIIINNQIGFTTDPRFARSTPYPSDIAKSINAPILHVNADDVESVIFNFQLAAEWRQTFHSDVILDVVGYRKYGHNETDQPSFTQPLMYQKIAEKKQVLDIYVDKLIKEGSFTLDDINEHKQWVWNTLEEAFTKSVEYKPTSREWLTTPWEGFKSPKELASEVLPHLPTSVERGVVERIGDTISSWPEGFEVHRNLKRILKNRKDSIQKGEGIDWSTGEALAFGSLVIEGYHVRISGQDVERGTFSQRHAVLHDQNSEKVYIPLKHLSKVQSDFGISNSSLSEYGCMGFEYGYSLTSPDALVMWEAQFGDFANTAQVIIDQFLAAGESKWKQRSGVVLSLPHGYDGQGSEHSSARLERYLQLCNEDPRVYPSPEKLERQHQDCNMQVAYPTTPANLFHLLRRQMHRQFRKPLILLFSKKLLRHPLARSNIEDFIGESSFQWIIEDSELGKTINDKEGIKRLVLCSGQVHSSLHKKRADIGDKETAVLKIEQLHPFPFEQLKNAIDSYPSLDEIVWCQEEPLNMGSYAFSAPRIVTVLEQTEKYKDYNLRYAGRNPAAAVAVGTKSMHVAQEEAFLDDVFQIQN
ncbi:Mitochondrial alpha-ketoglutarate dehydrogenase complex component [Komagataella phaffii CBS 7435]|uniref:2-oxoglutarate dehydrogenase, mitochondrial n=2 Tax=Komagataella phaffii TaxID=460519 RepID=C4QZL6_KOMPG|nr:Component of the mitochondrial alpha-ketoglutarate dehydrogenase complex, which catalyzes a key step [Komagataella phaffii GS115]AOA62167.1 GQ67_00112T0 [Komagataella phaffii]KAI0461029.1 2-oxoglutarate dehydrogenase E1 component [Komagataella kurtzmanii]CAH2448815.1 Mitochondrial alpha-ketoglutarate dehydrogenase complex component [Komagataella phaffii CBS 7435]AOA67423.1 GQ68_01276T0 [Komagataella phaffii GS115]CAY68690.1 Component of the mitochondrial alpha-ketoglutarate dehydrogenase co